MYLDGKQLMIVHEQKYLGVFLTDTMKDDCQIRGTSPGPLFIFPSKLPVSPNQFQTVFTGLLARLSLDPNIYKPHSFRIGAATLAFQQGNTVLQIQRMGRWKSTAFEKYIRVSQLTL